MGNTQSNKTDKQNEWNMKIKKTTNRNTHANKQTNKWTIFKPVTKQTWGVKHQRKQNITRMKQLKNKRQPTGTETQLNKQTITHNQ